MTPEQYLAEFAQRSGLEEKQIRRFLQIQAEMAYSHGQASFPIPGVGVVEVVVVPEKIVEHKFGPKKGQAVRIPARKKLRFRFTRTGAAGLFGSSTVMPEVMSVNWYPDPEDDIEFQPPEST